MRGGGVTLQTRGMMPGANKDLFAAASRERKSRERKS
jgi:hypothetical protein